jgi:hypothetical protein
MAVDQADLLTKSTKVSLLHEHLHQAATYPCAGPVEFVQ